MPSSVLKFLEDENIPSKSIDQLLKHDADIISVRSFRHGLSDYDVLKLAYKERRIVLTFDKEFGYLVFRKKIKSFGILLLRFIPDSPEQVSKRILELFDRKVEFHRNFVVVELDRIRVRSIS